MHLNLTVKYLAYRSSFLEMDLLIQVSESDDFDDITSIHYWTVNFDHRQPKLK